MSSLQMVTPALLLRAIIEYLPSTMTILLNTVFIVAIIRLRNLRTRQNIFLIKRQNYKNEKLLRQCAAFSCVFAIGWGLFACISVFDFNDIVPESIYLITLSFLSISLLVITLMIIHWNKLSSQRINIYFIAHKI
ncbi:unnamed protein product [Rotaria socialis]|uniref:Uncharacterized protein n=1 Tax=Rotaria socialis TaxID=392032 RepID=A0A820XEC1_9BILA|nr:unnamed protein product [Rotaria socialis]